MKKSSVSALAACKPCRGFLFYSIQYHTFAIPFYFKLLKWRLGQFAIRNFMQIRIS